MKLIKWEKLPDCMRTEEVRPYYDSLLKKRVQLALKRVFDIVCAVALLILLSPIIVVFAIWVKIDSEGPVFYCQTRVTQYANYLKYISLERWL